MDLVGERIIEYMAGRHAFKSSESKDRDHTVVPRNFFRVHPIPSWNESSLSHQIK